MANMEHKTGLLSVLDLTWVLLKHFSSWYFHAEDGSNGDNHEAPFVIDPQTKGRPSLKTSRPKPKVVARNSPSTKIPTSVITKSTSAIPVFAKGTGKAKGYGRSIGLPAQTTPPTAAIVSDLPHSLMGSDSYTSKTKRTGRDVSAHPATSALVKSSTHAMPVVTYGGRKEMDKQVVVTRKWLQYSPSHNVGTKKYHDFRRQNDTPLIILDLPKAVALFLNDCISLRPRQWLPTCGARNSCQPDSSHGSHDEPEPEAAADIHNILPVVKAEYQAATKQLGHWARNVNEDFDTDVVGETSENNDGEDICGESEAKLADNRANLSHWAESNDEAHDQHFHDAKADCDQLMSGMADNDAGLVTSSAESEYKEHAGHSLGRWAETDNEDYDRCLYDKEEVDHFEETSENNLADQAHWAGDEVCENRDQYFLDNSNDPRADSNGICSTMEPECWQAEGEEFHYDDEESLQAERRHFYGTYLHVDRDEDDRDFIENYLKKGLCTLQKCTWLHSKQRDPFSTNTTGIDLTVTNPDGETFYLEAFSASATNSWADLDDDDDF